MLRIQKPEKSTQPLITEGKKHPMALPGMRWVPNIALAPANLLQLQQNAGNRKLVELLQRYANPDNGTLTALKAYRAARKDGIVPEPGTDSETLMAENGPRYGDWNFQFVADGQSGTTAMYWITLNNYKNRQRHIFIDADTNQPIELADPDLDEQERKLLTEWAEQLLSEQLSGVSAKAEPPSQATPSAIDKEEDDEQSPYLLGGGDDEDENNNR